jgi:hypothetical protein
MPQSSSSGPTTSAEEKMRRRDWIVLPLVCLLTIGLLACSTELIARRVFHSSRTLMANCMVLDDSSTGPRAIPNTVCWEQFPESPLVEYKFNNCGHRAGMECGPKEPGTYRIVLTGSSFALGERVPREQTFAALLPTELSQVTGHKVELYNASMGWGFSHSVTLRFNEVLAENPDMVLWILTPADIEGASIIVRATRDEMEQQSSKSLPTKAWLRVRTAFATESFRTASSEVFSHTRTALMLRHFLYESRSQYLKCFLKAGDEEAGFLNTDPSSEWKGHLEEFERDFANVEPRIEAEGVPLVVILVPNRAEAGMISMGNWPAGYSPYKLGDELRNIVTSHGGVYIDILPEFRHMPDTDQYYLPVDGHLNANGHMVISNLLAKDLTRGAVPALRVDERHQAILEAGN